MRETCHSPNLTRDPTTVARVAEIATPFDDSAALSVKLLSRGELKAYPGFPHGMPTTHADQINADLLVFIRS